jgi:hypothetical protein
MELLHSASCVESSASITNSMKARKHFVANLSLSGPAAFGHSRPFASSRWGLSPGDLAVVPMPLRGIEEILAVFRHYYRV